MTKHRHNFVAVLFLSVADFRSRRQSSFSLLWGTPAAWGAFRRLDLKPRQNREFPRSFHGVGWERTPANAIDTAVSTKLPLVADNDQKVTVIVCVGAAFTCR